MVASGKGIDAGSVSNFIHDVGLTGNIKTTLRLIAKEGTELPADSVFASCKGAITVRNAIMHEGRRTVGVSEVGGWIPDIERMIEFCGLLGR